ncbi:predicted protein [Nematostella vectensis]|uniref:Cation-dependent mannose-6-phosphate receptor n=2 Tax=Nematostella vectensis TaxID=45351 RepID=A7RHI0_NEMVE|nr:predicted protein [Nematostella vectensis]|eukprot:XP_001640915.1 predicted protein [Nematostella vectensis]
MALPFARSFKECKKVDACRCQTDEGEIDLRNLAGKDGKPRFSDISDAKADQKSFLYDFNPCNPWTKPKPAVPLTYSCDNVAACLTIATTSLLNIGTQDSAQCVLDRTSGSCSLVFTGEAVGEITTTHIQLKCREGVDGILDPFRSDMDTRVFRSTLHSKYVCMSGLSVGSILLIIFFTLVVVYLITGIVFNKFKKGAEGKEVLPNLAFWVDFPILVKDGIIFTIQSSKKCCSSSEYNKI